MKGFLLENILPLRCVGNSVEVVDGKGALVTVPPAYLKMVLSPSLPRLLKPLPP